MIWLFLIMAVLLGGLAACGIAWWSVGKRGKNPPDDLNRSYDKSMSGMRFGSQKKSDDEGDGK